MQYECHAHMVLDGLDFRQALQRHKNGPDEAWIREQLISYKNAGVGYIRDGGDKLGVGILAAELSEEYNIIYRSPVFAIHRRGRYGSMLGRAYESIAEYRSLVEEVKRQKGDFIKLMLTGILDFNEYGKISSEPVEPEEMKELIRIAHGEGFAVMVHCNGADSVKAAVAAGADSLEHGFYMDEQAMSDLAASDTIWVPTFSPVANQIGSGRFPDAVLRKITEEQALKVRHVSDIGGIVAPGSDAGAFAVIPGEGTKDEYGYMKAAVDAEAVREGEIMIENTFVRR